MSQDLLSYWGTSHERVVNALKSLQDGNGVIIVDDDDRENEGDLIFSTEHLTSKQMAMLIRDCSGIVCLCINQEKADSLNLTPMVAHNNSSYGTAFTVTIEAAHGVTTGVSAADRVCTIKAAAKEGAIPEDLRRPGHVFPLIAKKGGVLERPGHTESTVDIMRLAGLPPHGVLCEITNPDGTMSRLPELKEYSILHSIPLLSVQDLIAYRKSTNS